VTSWFLCIEVLSLPGAVHGDYSTSRLTKRGVESIWRLNGLESHHSVRGDVFSNPNPTLYAVLRRWSNAKHHMKLQTAPNTIFMFHCSVSAPADDPQRRYTAGAFDDLIRHNAS